MWTNIGRIIQSDKKPCLYLLERQMPFRKWDALIFLYCIHVILMYSHAGAQSHAIIDNNFLKVEGIPNISINAIAQDGDGYIWIGTSKGLYKYDGYQYVGYKNIFNDSTSISDNGVRSLFVDSKGVLWVGTTSLNRYNRSCDCFTIFSDVRAVRSFAEDADHNLWVGTNSGGLLMYDKKTERFTRFLNNTSDSISLVNDQINTLLFDRDGLLWIGTGDPFTESDIHAHGLLSFDPASRNVRQYVSSNSNQNGLKDNRVTALLEDTHGQLLIGSSQSGLHYYDVEDDVIVQIEANPDQPEQLHAPIGNSKLTPTPFVQILYEDNDGGFWVGTFSEGLNYFDPSGTRYNYHANDTSATSTFTNSFVWAFLEDQQGHIWVGNRAEGLYRYNP